jgi:comEA protein
MENPRFERYLTVPPRKPSEFEQKLRQICDELAHKIGLRQLKPKTALMGGALLLIIAGVGLVRSGLFAPREQGGGGSVTQNEAPASTPATAPAAETTVTVQVFIDKDGEGKVVAQAPGEEEEQAGTAQSTSSSDDARVNLNNADAATLTTLPGVGPATAEKIITDRQKNGPFSAPEDLMRVSGIGPKKFEAVKDLIVVR